MNIIIKIIFIFLFLQSWSFAQTINPIDGILNHLKYPQNTWNPIKVELGNLLKKIDFPHLKVEATSIKSNPEKLKAFVIKLGKLIDENGYTETHPPHPLIKLMTSSLVDDDISQVIFTSPISFLQKVDSKKSLVACTAISQLGSIILRLLDINVKIGFSPGHVFNCIPLDSGEILFVDFTNQIFEIVDINKYYLNLGSRSMLLKDKYVISPQRVREINAQLPSELQSDSLEELLNFLYLYIFISDDYASTPGILINIANIYSQKENYELAISHYDQAIAMNPEYAEGYRERGITYGNKGDITKAIADFSKAIELFPEFADAFHDRANIYNVSGESDLAIDDFNQAIIINPNYEEAYHERGDAYIKRGEIDRALADYDKAIEIDPYFSESYQSRAEAYFSKGEYDKSWADIHQVESFGDEVNSDLIDKLKKAGLTKYFMAGLIIAPILILIIFYFF